MQSSENVSTKSSKQFEEVPKGQTLLELLQDFNKDQVQGVKNLKEELSQLGKQMTVKDIRIQLDNTKKVLGEACKLKEKLLTQKSDIADSKISQQLKLITTVEL